MKWTVALLASFALLIPGAAVASAKSTSCSYTHNCSLSKVDHASAHRTPASKSTAPATASKSPSSPTAVQNDSTVRTSTGSLPFTGLDVGGLAAGAVVLLGAGLMLRRVSADRS